MNLEQVVVLVELWMDGHDGAVEDACDRDGDPDKADGGGENERGDLRVRHKSQGVFPVHHRVGREVDDA